MMCLKSWHGPADSHVVHIVQHRFRIPGSLLKSRHQDGSACWAMCSLARGKGKGTYSGAEPSLLDPQPPPSPHPPVVGGPRSMALDSSVQRAGTSLRLYRGDARTRYYAYQGTELVRELRRRCAI